jgi:quinoprotein glucose dehydrogenase
MPLFRRILDTGELAEQRAVYAALGRLQTPEARELLHYALSERFRIGLMSEEITLDFILAVQEGGDDIQKRTLESALGSRKTLHGELGDWYYSAFGGDFERGRSIFREKAELSCLRCHPDGDAAGEGIGPDLRGIGRRLGRRQILESIVLPNARIAPGYESFLLRLVDESVVAGRILSEDAELVRVLQADGAIVEIPTAEIELRRPDLSAMPEGHAQHLDRLEMRDLVEYVSGL